LRDDVPGPIFPYPEDLHRRPANRELHREKIPNANSADWLMA
jgi:hypothetical protein